MPDFKLHGKYDCLFLRNNSFDLMFPNKNGTVQYKNWKGRAGYGSLVRTNDELIISPTDSLGYTATLTSRDSQGNYRWHIELKAGRPILTGINENCWMSGYRLLPNNIKYHVYVYRLDAVKILLQGFVEGSAQYGSHRPEIPGNIELPTAITTFQARYDPLEDDEGSGEEP